MLRPHQIGQVQQFFFNPRANFVAKTYGRPFSIAALIILIMGCQLSGEQSLRAEIPTTAQTLPIEAMVNINGVAVELEVAKTPEQQAIGLMHRTKALGENRGMLFPFEPSRPVGFWMKNTLIPLDIIYLKDQTVVTIHSNVPPCKVKQCPTYQSKGSVNQVLELDAGQAARLGLKEGDTLNVGYIED